jgi:hypothetical protein
MLRKEPGLEYEEFGGLPDPKFFRQRGTTLLPLLPLLIGEGQVGLCKQAILLLTIDPPKHMPPSKFLLLFPMNKTMADDDSSKTMIGRE